MIYDVTVLEVVEVTHRVRTGSEREAKELVVSESYTTFPAIHQVVQRKFLKRVVLDSYLYARTPD